MATLISRKTARNTIRSTRSGSRLEAEPETKRLVIPVFGVLVATFFAFLAFLPSQSPSAEQVGLDDIYANQLVE